MEVTLFLCTHCGCRIDQNEIFRDNCPECRTENFEWESKTVFVDTEEKHDHD